MSRTMAQLLLAALAKRKESFRSIAAGAGVNHVSILRFLAGKQRLHLDSGDKLAKYLGIESRQGKGKGKAKGKGA